MIDTVYSRGLELIRAIQNLDWPLLDPLMRAFTFLGSPVLYLALVPLLFWCVDEQKTFRLGILMIFSLWLNNSLKMIFAQPRPYALDPSVAKAHEYGEANQYGLPSGHAQHSLLFGLGLASWKGTFIFYAAAAAFSLLTGASRLYLGVHFPTDLAGGWIIALALFGLNGFLVPFFAGLFESGGNRAKLVTLALLAFVINSIHYWHQGPGGLLLGFGSGYVLMKSRFPFSAAFYTGNRIRKIAAGIIRYVLGMAGLAAIFFVLEKILPGELSPYARLARFCRYGIAGFWVSGGAPFFFVRWGLAKPE
jgi:membrane-associated phospholipid phosphatase